MADVHRQPLTSFDWQKVAADVTENGAAILRNLMPPASCESIAKLYDHPEGFRSHVSMARHNFGKGEYRYFAYPLPPWLATLRSDLYARLAPIANQWAADLSYERSFPAAHREYLEQCHAAGQRRPIGADGRTRAAHGWGSRRPEDPMNTSVSPRRHSDRAKPRPSRRHVICLSKGECEQQEQS